MQANLFFCSRECTTDFVEVFDTIDGSGRGLGHICGSWRQYTLVTIGEVAYVHFVSTGQAQFEASFVTVGTYVCTMFALISITARL